MRRSGRSRTKSLKAQLEEDVQTSYEQLKLQSPEKIKGRWASIGTGSQEELESESGGDGAESMEVEVSEVRNYESESEKLNTKENDGRSSGITVTRVEEGVGEGVGEGVDTVAEEVGGEGGCEERVGGEGGCSIEESVHGRWRHYHSLCTSLPGREKQIHLLLSLLGEVSYIFHTLFAFTVFFVGTAATSVDVSCCVCIW